MVQAKASLLYALGRLKPADRFNVIRFDDTMDVLFSDTVPADAEHVAQAKSFVAALQARGGTEMVPPMKAALTDRRGGDANTRRARSSSSPTARSATSSSCSTPSAPCAGARACSWSASARRPTAS